jgi:Putative peptidoglycan binding domain
MWRPLSLSAALLLGTAGLAQAADAQSRFQAHGLGRVSCQRFVEICEGKREECKLTGTWLEGYLSGFNALSEGTFDILPWQPPEALAEFTFNVCKQNPKAPMLEVVNELIRTLLVPQRVKAASDRVRIGEGEGAVALYRETVRAAQQRLVELGFLKGGVDGAFGPGTRTAVEAFQRAAGLEPTGTPDTRTLLDLFYGRPRQEGAAAAPQASRQPAPAAPAAPAATAPAGQPPARLDLNLGGPTLQ